MSARRTSATGSGLWATPSASDSTRGGTITDSMTGISLVQQMNTPHRWPTPTVCGNYNRAGLSPKSDDGLATAVAKWPTPTSTLGTNGGRVTPAKAREGETLIEALSARTTWPTPQASDNRNRGNADTPAIARRIEAGKQVMLTMTVSGGQLSPDWTEWLMGWPIGHTDLKPLATDKFQQWQQQHGVC
jgi:hypothetical protein